MQRVLLPISGQDMKCDSHNPHDCPCGRAEPLATAPSPKPEQPSNQHGKQCPIQDDSGQGYHNLERPRYLPKPDDPEAWIKERFGGEKKEVSGVDGSRSHPRHRQQPDPAADPETPNNQSPRVTEHRPAPAWRTDLQKGAQYLVRPLTPIPGGVGAQQPPTVPLQPGHEQRTFLAPPSTVWWRPRPGRQAGHRRHPIRFGPQCTSAKRSRPKRSSYAAVDDLSHQFHMTLGGEVVQRCA
jgi:hypothetical protein